MQSFLPRIPSRQQTSWSWSFLTFNLLCYHRRYALLSRVSSGCHRVCCLLTYFLFGNTVHSFPFDSIMHLLPVRIYLVRVCRSTAFVVKRIKNSFEENIHVRSSSHTYLTDFSSCQMQPKMRFLNLKHFTHQNLDQKPS